MAARRQFHGPLYPGRAAQSLRVEQKAALRVDCLQGPSLPWDRRLPQTGVLMLVNRLQHEPG